MQKTYHFTFIRNRESCYRTLPIYYTARVRAGSEVAAFKKAWERLREFLGNDSWSKSYADPQNEYYRCVPVSAERSAIRKFFDSVPVDRVDYIWSSMVGSHRKTAVNSLTPRRLKSLLTGTSGKITRFRHGITIRESKYDSLTGAITHISHDLVVRGAR